MITWKIAAAILIPVIAIRTTRVYLLYTVAQKNQRTAKGGKN